MKIRAAERRATTQGQAADRIPLPTHWVPIVALSLLAIFTLSAAIVAVIFPASIKSSLRNMAVAAGHEFFGPDIPPHTAALRLSERLLDNIFDRPAIPTLVFDINFRNLKRLYEKRKQALRIGYLVQEEDDLVPASIRIGNRTVDVRLRLKGDMTDHIRTDRWSFRIQTKGDDHIFGMRRFSIQHPETRGYQGEVLFLETLRRLDVLAPRYRFVNVVVNGNHVGLMALEEHFSKELLESNGRREGVIIRFDESVMWADRVARGRDAVRYRGPLDSIYNAPISPFRQGTIMKSESLKRQYVTAAGLLRAFRDDQLSASEVFDVELLGKFIAAAELWGAWHALDWNNQRFYLNPLTQRLEPIGFDGHLKGDIEPGTINAPQSLTRRMLNDPAIHAAFERSIRDLKTQVERGDLIPHLEKVQLQVLRELRTDFQLLEAMDLSNLRKRASELPYPVIDTKPPGKFAVHVFAHLVDKDGKRYLELSNPLPHPVEVIGIDGAEAMVVEAADGSQQILPYPIQLPPWKQDTRRETVLIELTQSALHVDAPIIVKSRIVGQSEVKSVKATPGVLPMFRNPLPKGNVEDLIAKNPFLTLSASGDRVEATAGEWYVSGSLVLPRPLGLHVPESTTLLFEPDASLIVFGPVTLEGSPVHPVVLGAADGRSWQGVVVHESDTGSYWTHVHVKNTAGVRWSSWEMTGGVTFYRSDVTLSGCRFEANLAEDALNIIHSKFELEETQFERTASDGLDIDFAEGSIRGGSFYDIGTNTGSDGLDMSGSVVELVGTRFARITDKGISVGEGSKVTARDVLIEQSMVGAVSKDASALTLTDSTIRNARIAGLMSYVKKPEFGVASLHAENVVILDTQTLAMVQHGSTLRLNGSGIPPQLLDVEKLYQTTMRPGGRR